MKIFLIIVLTAITVNSFAQENDSIKKVSYCGKEFDIQNECPTNSKYELICEDYQIQWVYFPDHMLSMVYENTLRNIEQKMNIIEKKEIKLKSLKKKISGYLLTYIDSNGEAKYRIIASGKVKKQSLILNIGLNEEPLSNQNLPDFVKNFVMLIE